MKEITITINNDIIVEKADKILEMFGGTKDQLFEGFLTQWVKDFEDRASAISKMQ